MPRMRRRRQYFIDPHSRPRQPRTLSVDGSGDKMDMTYNFDGIEPIAIVGMSCKFPGAKNIDAFWSNLKDGKESLSLFTEKELLDSGIDREVINDPAYVSASCIIDDIEMFDFSFFGYSAAEAELIDPQQRLLLMCAYETFEDAGYAPAEYDGDVGVFTSVRTSGYVKILNRVFQRPGTSKSFEALLGTAVDQACMRISYGLNLRGPSISVQTACSASVVGAHMACESLRNRECDAALAGAASILIPQKQGYLYEDGTIVSPDGHCRAFDVKAGGAVGGNGVGMVLLKRMTDAVRDRDRIYAIIRGSAVNNDGSSKVGYRAPNLEGQADVIEEALMMADVDAETISYVEANGTGTFIGDSIEIEALTRNFRNKTDEKTFCGIGSVKTNIGHLAQGAGIAALIKTALSLKNRQIPPSLNCETPNPKLRESPFYVVTKLTDWETNGFPRRAGINSFAIGGTNSHMVLEEAPVLDKPLGGGKRACHILTIAAKNEDALRAMTGRYLRYLDSDTSAVIEDICHTSNLGRTHHAFRFSAVAGSKAQLREQIKAIHDSDTSLTGVARHPEKPSPPKIAYLFSDIDTGFTGMRRDFYHSQPHFRDAVDECAGILEKHYDIDLISALFNEGPIGGGIDGKTAVFAMEYALAQMWRTWGAEPCLVMGDGVGEYVAACVAGILRVEDGLKFISIEEGIETTLGAMGDIPFYAPNINMVSSKAGLLDSNKAISRQDFRFGEPFQPLDDDAPWEHLHGPAIGQVMVIGPAKTILGRRPGHVLNKNQLVLGTISTERDQWRRTLECLGELYVRGLNVHWNSFAQDCGYQRTSLPTYPFERSPCWFKG